MPEHYFLHYMSACISHTIVTLTHIVWSSPQGFNAYVMAQHTWAHG